ncbi:hypothetical protein E2C01_061553 [Portunus trituberculatus]|uniref:Uncharacterized protein n=1 Tax=Portunus trituberculatus TaxID=210409 RepID=A0A5B7HEP8_PORTR|nr:hypothetical protein [Portunus trituberculatus]
MHVLYDQQSLPAVSAPHLSRLLRVGKLDWWQWWWWQCLVYRFDFSGMFAVVECDCESKHEVFEIFEGSEQKVNTAVSFHSSLLRPSSTSTKQNCAPYRIFFSFCKAYSACRHT